MMQRLSFRLVLVVGLLTVIAAVGVASYHLIPVFRPLWGLDFQNQWVFHNCREVRLFGLYADVGGVCGDAKARAYVYPPALFHAFTWVRWLSFDAAVKVWTVAQVIVMVAIGVAWARIGRLPRTGWRWLALSVLWVILLIQYPMIFALERGNNDVLPLALWSLSALWFTLARPAAAGGAAGLAATLKVYPALSAIVIAVGMLKQPRRLLVPFALGGLTVTVLVSLIWFDETVTYLTEALPTFAGREAPELRIFSHTLSALPAPSLVIIVLALALVGSWIAAAWVGIDRNPGLVFAGALAISTYLSSTSWDYNLITVYPLVLLVTARALQTTKAGQWQIASLALMLTVIAGRGLFSAPVQLWLQVITLTWVAWLVVADRETAPIHAVQEIEST